MYLTNRMKDGDHIILHLKETSRTMPPFQILLMHQSKQWRILEVTAKNNHLYEVRIDLEEELLGKHIQVVYKSKNNRQLLTCFTLPQHLFEDPQQKQQDVLAYFDVPVSSELMDKEASLILNSIMKGR